VGPVALRNSSLCGCGLARPRSLSLTPLTFAFICCGTASQPVNAIMPKPTADDVSRHLRLAAARCQSKGVTTVFDMATSPAGMAAYQDLSQGPVGDFPVRVRMYPTAAVYAPGKSRASAAPPAGFGDDRLRMGGMKTWSDGSLQGYTGFLSKPYAFDLRQCLVLVRYARHNCWAVFWFKSSRGLPRHHS
jgi:predicted amidohydrolase YtcJ